MSKGDSEGPKRSVGAGCIVQMQVQGEGKGEHLTLDFCCVNSKLYVPYIVLLYRFLYCGQRGHNNGCIMTPAQHLSEVHPSGKAEWKKGATTGVPAMVGDM